MPRVLLTRVNVDPEIVAGFMSSLNVAVIAVLFATAVAPGAGTVTVTVGRVVSGSAAVVKVHTKFAARPLPARSVAPLVTVAVNWVLSASVVGVVGVKIAVRLDAE